MTLGFLATMFQGRWHPGTNDDKAAGDDDEPPPLEEVEGAADEGSKMEEVDVPFRI